MKENIGYLTVVKTKIVTQTEHRACQVEINQQGHQNVILNLVLDNSHIHIYENLLALQEITLTFHELPHSFISSQELFMDLDSSP